MLTHSQVDGQSGMNIEWISEVYWHNQPRPPNIILETVGTTMIMIWLCQSLCPLSTSGVWILSVECWLSIISFGPGSKLMTITQHSTLKTPISAPCIWMGNLECGRIHIPCSGFCIQIHGLLSVVCWVSFISLGPGIWSLDPSMLSFSSCYRLQV